MKKKILMYPTGKSPVHQQELGVILKSKLITGKGMFLHTLKNNLKLMALAFELGVRSKLQGL